MTELLEVALQVGIELVGEIVGAMIEDRSRPRSDLDGTDPG